MPWGEPILLPPPDSVSSADASAASHIPASLIFNQKEMKQYQRWQRREKNIYSARDGLGRLPTAQQYGEYQRWRQYRKSCDDDDDDEFRGRAFTGAWTLSSELGEHLAAPKCTEESSRVREDSAFSNGDDDERDRQQSQVITATMCKHVLHPMNANCGHGKQEYCPVCTVSHHIRYMNLLTKAVNATAEDKSPEEVVFDGHHANDSAQHDNICYAWRTAKIYMYRVIEDLQEDAVNEKLWHAKNPEIKYDSHSDDGGIHSEDDSKIIMSAARAVAMYWDGLVPTSRTADEATFTNTRPDTQANRAAAPATDRKHVTFTESTNYEPGRNQESYWRRHLRYSPGKWAFEAEHTSDEEELSDDDHDIEQSYFIDDYLNDYDMDEDEVPDDESAGDGDAEWAMLIKASVSLQLSQQNESSETVTETLQNSMQSSVNELSSQSSIATEGDGNSAEVEAGKGGNDGVGANDLAGNGPAEHSVPNLDHGWGAENGGSGFDFDDDEDEVQDEHLAEVSDDGGSDWETEDSEADDEEDSDGEGDFVVFGY